MQFDFKSNKFILNYSAGKHKGHFCGWRLASYQKKNVRNQFCKKVNFLLQDLAAVKELNVSA